MAVQIQLRRDSAADWASANPVLALGEPGVETDTLKVKVGDGSTAWNSLAYSITTQFADLNGKPTTLAGYGITDGGGDVTAISTTTFTNKSGNISQWTNDSNYLTSIPAQSFSSLTGKPTTIAGYGITDAFDGTYGSLSGTPTLGTAAATASTDYATAAQGATADTAIQPNTSPTLTNATLTGYLAGPASFTIDPAAVGDNTGTVVIAGNLQVDGTQTTINSTTVAIDDLKLSVATDAADSAAANGAGITVGGANANITYTHATTSWDFDKPVNVTGNIGVTGTVDGVDIQTLNTTAGAALPKAGGTMTGRPVLNYQNPEIRFDDSDTSNNGEITLDNASLRIESDPDDAVADSTIKFNVDNDTKMIVLSSGNVGIGVTPSQIFEVQKAADDKLVYGSNPRLVLDTPTGINGLRVLGDTTPFEFKIDSGTYNGSTFSMGGTGDVSLLGTTTTASDTFNDSPTFFFNSMRWNGSANATHFQGAIKGHTRSATNGDGYLGIGADANANHITIETDGTVGVGTTDLDSWSSVFDGRVRLGATGFIGSTSASTQLGNNWYYDGTVYKRIASDLALRYYQNGGEHVWQTAVTGSADSTLTWVTKMTLSADGDLTIPGDITAANYSLAPFSTVNAQSMPHTQVNTQGAGSTKITSYGASAWSKFDAVSSNDFGGHDGHDGNPADYPAYVSVYLGEVRKAVNRLNIVVHGNSFGFFELQGSNNAGTSGTYNSGQWTSLPFVTSNNSSNNQNAGGQGSGLSDGTVLTFQYDNNIAYQSYRLWIKDNSIPSESVGTRYQGWATYYWELYRV